MPCILRASKSKICSKRACIYMLKYIVLSSFFSTTGVIMEDTNIDKSSQTKNEGSQQKNEIQKSESEPLQPEQITRRQLKRTIKQELEEHQKRVQEYTEHLQRLQAEFENFQKRTEREKQDMILYGKEQVILKLLTMLDNFEHAISSIKASAKDSGAGKEIVIGIEMLFKEFKSIIEAEGVSIISCSEKFNSSEHEAMLVQESELPEGTILQEIQRGYKLKGKVIRPAKVIVSNGQSKDKDAKEQNVNTADNQIKE
ncbi:nucleotide exchange factor GrpE [archaeon]|nr:nucleotide exchange factor GrpE [archaeon]